MDEGNGLRLGQIHKAEAGVSPTRVEDSSNADLLFHDHRTLGFCCEECNPARLAESEQVWVEWQSVGNDISGYLLVT